MSETASPPVAGVDELVEKLRDYAAASQNPQPPGELPRRLVVGPNMFRLACEEAADMIERLRAPEPPVVGWQDISMAPRQEPVIVGHERLLGWRRMAICNALGEWSYYDRPWLQQDPLDEAPTHWMAWPDAPPTASVSPGMETLQASECTKTSNGETIAQTCLRLADDRTLNIIPAVRCALRMAHDALTTTKHGEGDQ